MNYKGKKARTIVVFIIIVCGVGFGLYEFCKAPILAWRYDRIINSSSSREEAYRAVENEFNSINETFSTSKVVIKNKIIEETEDYYGLAVSWRYRSDHWEKGKYDEYSENVISYKKKVYDYKASFDNVTGKREVIEQFNTKNKRKIKTILDISYRLKNKRTGSFKWVGSSLTEEGDDYVYILNFKETCYGDFGLEDTTRQTTVKKSIDKGTGRVAQPPKIEYNDK